MSKQHGSWTIYRSIEQYSNAFITVYEDQVRRPDGEPGTYGTVTMKPGVAILPIDTEGWIYLVKQFRYALGQESLEVVCGALEPEEPPVTAAQRELQEEVGIRADQWFDLGTMNLDTSIVRCPVHLFLAQQLHFTQTSREGTETIETIKLSFKEATEMALNGTITHAPSVVLLLKAALKFSNADSYRTDEAITDKVERE